MREHKESRLVPYTADLMYRVVADIERYPEFLPWVSALRLLSATENELTAEMLVSYGPFRERYTSQVALDPAARTIAVTAIKGPFRTLENHWRFVPVDTGCDIQFTIGFEFRNPLLQRAAAKAFEKVMLKMTDSFVSRAAKMSG